MKIDRLIGILSILLQKEKVTAPLLSEKFEVSRRTIHRDIEDLCKAGIPLITIQGKNGGISIMEGYCMDRTILTSNDMQAILAGLKSLDSVCGTNKYQQLMEKISLKETSNLLGNDSISINLSSWSPSSLISKIQVVEEAMEENQLISFWYYSKKGESSRVIEPYRLLFQWSSWYVWGYCRIRKDYRMFKLSRMTEVVNTKEWFEKRTIPENNKSLEYLYCYNIKVQIKVSVKMKWRIIEEVGIIEMKEENEMLIFQTEFTDKESMFGWLLSLGTEVELLEPKEYREEFYELTKKINEKYKER